MSDTQACTNQTPERKRPELDDIVKMRRAALRQQIRVNELREELERLGDNQDEIDAITGPGVRPKSRADKLARQEMKLEVMIAAIAAYEKQHCIEHVPLDQVYDPLVAKGTMKKVGRPGKNKFTELDRKLLLASRNLESTLEQWEEAGADYPPAVRATEKTGQRYGRKPKSFPQRVVEIKLEVEKAEKTIATLESKLSRIELMERQLKLVRDSKRETVKQQKLALSNNGPDSPEYLAAEQSVAAYEADIKQLVARIARAKERQAEGISIKEETPVPKLQSPVSSKLQTLLAQAEAKLSSSALAPKTLSDIDVKIAERDVEKTERYLELLKRKKALLDEIEKLEAEMSTLK